MLKKECLERGYREKEVFDIIEDMKAASDVTIQLINDLLTQDKIEEGTMHLDRTPTGVWDVVKNTVQPFFSQVR